MSSGRGRGNFWRGRGQRFRGHRRSGSTGQAAPQRRGQVTTSQDSTRPQVQRQQPHQVQTSLTNSPYKKWSVYFPDSVYSPESPLGSKVKAIMKFVESHSAQLSKDEIENKRAVVFDYADLISDPELNKDFPSLAGDLRDQPTTVLQSLGLAVSQVASFKLKPHH